jgi:hypothetical protein
MTGRTLHDRFPMNRGLMAAICAGAREGWFVHDILEDEDGFLVTYGRIFTSGTTVCRHTREGTFVGEV